MATKGDDLGSLEGALNAAMKAMKDGLEDTIKSAGTGGLVTAVRETPVDEGPARSSWIVTVGAPSSETRAAFVPGKKQVKGESAIAAAAIAAGKAVIACFKIESKQPLTIVNNQDYIVLLDQGASSQSPEGMSDKAEARILEDILKGLIRSIPDKINRAILRS